MEKELQFRLVPMEENMLPIVADICTHAPDSWSLVSLRQALQNEHSHLFAALDENNVPIGFACFSLMDDTTDLEMLAVAPACRRRGVGRAILQHALPQLASLGAGRCLLEVRLSNLSAIALYEQLGFKTLARRPGMYSRPSEDGLLMERALSGGYPAE